MPEFGLQLGRLPKSSGLINTDRARVFEVSRLAAPLKEKGERDLGAQCWCPLDTLFDLDQAKGVDRAKAAYRAKGPSALGELPGPSNAPIEVFLPYLKKPVAPRVGLSEPPPSVVVVQGAGETDPVRTTETWRQPVDNSAPTC